MSALSRRQFLRGGAAAAGGAALALAMPGHLLASSRRYGPASERFGPTLPDPGGLLDLPRGFQYRVLSAEGSFLSNGQTVPGNFDGMACFADGPDSVLLVRNHELSPNANTAVEGRNPFDPREQGGTTGIVVAGARRRAVSDFVTSSGTRLNCAGGATPWGTWLTCEEARASGHGYVFEVDPRAPESELSRTPIRAMGFFSHEAVAVDGRTGTVYLTEDRRGTPSSFLYRYLPFDRARRPGALQAGGVLEAMAIESAPSTDPDVFSRGQRLGVVWRRVEPDNAPLDAMAKGCVRFDRLEGCAFAAGAVWFADTSGGEARLGQVYRYLPAGRVLELFYEGTYPTRIERPDNLIITPWGDLWWAEDGDGGDRLMGITPAGDIYRFATNRLNSSEFAGPCFSPSGGTFFINVQRPGLTYAIWGRFPLRGGRSRAAMAVAAPPRGPRPEQVGRAR